MNNLDYMAGEVEFELSVELLKNRTPMIQSEKSPISSFILLTGEILQWKKHAETARNAGLISM
jgi:hypothetical protein